MSVISHNELVNLVKRGILTDTPPDRINSASIDISIGSIILVEAVPPENQAYEISLREREKPQMLEMDLDPEEGYVLLPGQFILAQSAQVFHLPNWVSAEYKLKSSMARIGLEHLNAGWCDAGWNGSVLTLELKNMTEHHAIRIRPGDLIGQIIFYKHKPVPTSKSYATRGRYNGDKSVSTIKK